MTGYFHAQGALLPQAEGVEQARERIAETEGKLRRATAAVIPLPIEQGRNLARLKELARGTWEDELNTVGIHPRVASRLMAVADNWSDEGKAPPPDLYPLLPIDPQKLVPHSQLPAETLRALCQALDLREATRAEVIAAVRDAQGQEPQPAAMPPTVKGLRERVRTVLDNFRKEIQRFDAAQREMIEELETPLSKLNQALAEGEGWTRSPASSPPPARTARRPANLPRGPTPTTPAPGRRRRPADTRRRCRPETVRPAAPAHQRPRKRPETLTPGTVWPTTAAGHDSVAPKLFAPKGDCDAI